MFVKKYWSLAILFLSGCGLPPANSQSDTSAESKQSLSIVHMGDDTRVLVVPMCKEPLPGIWFVHVHEDEATAVLAATEFIDSTGQGCFMTLKHGMGRNIQFTLGGITYKFDPNRIYTDAGRRATLARLGPY
ncbi:MAG TPA: hypothetical protein VK907_11205, partial [Phnomibacter sp.]|nr:hypothetical protein [Phnomibacter sp.]